MCFYNFLFKADSLKRSIYNESVCTLSILMHTGLNLKET